MSDIHPIAVPKWGIEMVEGTVNTWLKQPGEAVTKGEEILEIESDKIVNVWEAPADGVLRRQLVDEGDTRGVGQLLGIIAGADVDDASIDDFIASFAGGKKAEAEAAPAPAAAAPQPAAAPPASRGDGGRASPVVKRLASELGVDLATVTGSGRNGRITQEDVHAAAQGGAAAPAADAPSDYTVVPFSATRKTIAQRLTRAKQDVPHYYLSVEWQVDGLLAAKNRLSEASGSKISLNDLIVHCVAKALIAEPRVNINVVDDAVHQFQHANIAIAIATDDGLYPATLRQAETLTPAEIAAATRELAERARQSSLTRDDLSGASFTISNLGMFGIDQFTAIINPPMGAILALGTARQRAVVKDGELAVATVMTASLSCDHRAIDGAVGAAFLAALKAAIDEVSAA